MKKNILVIQSRICKEAIAIEQVRYEQAVEGKATVNFISSLDQSIAWENPCTILNHFDAVIFAGSADFDFDGGRTLDDTARTTSKEIVARVSPLVLFSLKNNFPLLGICYGHQIVSEVLGVPVMNDHAQMKTGTYEVTLTEEGKQDALFSMLPEAFFAQYRHNDSLSGLPHGATLLANSGCCKTSALRYGTKVYTMQFHPEVTHDDSAWMLVNSEIVKPTVEASLIIPHFIETILV